jgi:hypothetical protein
MYSCTSNFGKVENKKDNSKLFNGKAESVQKEKLLKKCA